MVLEGNPLTGPFKQHPMRSPQPYLTVASILSGFCISVFMFRIQRELGVRERHPDWRNWLAWADYLVLATIVLCLVLVVVPLVLFPEPSELVFSVAAATCAASSLLLLAYPFAILDHYGIEIGGWRRRPGDNVEIRHKGEPIERIIVVVTIVIAILMFITVVLVWNS
jgi:peptidoglycan biosynthesis protein MviN/MurJ (putative lipid II flippase)